MNSDMNEEKLARMLRVPKRTIAELAVSLERVTGKAGVMEKIVAENERLVSEKLGSLGVSHEAPAQEVYDALVSRVEADDLNLLKLIGHSSLRGYPASLVVVEFVKKAYGGVRRGYFLKHEKARELLRAEPPKKILEALGYGTVDEMLAKEDLAEVYSALRFLEDEEWQNKIFFAQYAALLPHDFEERDVEMKALGEKWAAVAEKFVAKKYHNVSHLKELGVIFVIPIFLGISGETLRLVSLLLHYFHEVAYYADLFRAFSKKPENFAKNVVSALRGDVIERRAPRPVQEADRPRFLVVQRYLAKIDPNDWRLAEPRVNPEALHWQRAEEDVMQIEGAGLGFWNGMGWVSDFFHTDLGEDALISFNLGDVVMTLVKRKEVRYLYHEQEALWNEIFTEYFSVKELEARTKRHIVEGWFEV